MVRPLQQLGIVHRLFADVRRGRKTSTIRYNEGVVESGSLRFVCDDHPAETVVVDVIRTTQMPLTEVAGFVGEDWTDAILLEGMRSHYPNIELDSVVRVIEFRLPASSSASTSH